MVVVIYKQRVLFSREHGNSTVYTYICAMYTLNVYVDIYTVYMLNIYTGKTISMHTELFAQCWGGLWPDSPTYWQDCTTFYIWLNSVYNELKLKEGATTLCYTPLPQGGTPGIPLPLFEFQLFCVVTFWLQLINICLSHPWIFDILIVDCRSLVSIFKCAFM